MPSKFSKSIDLNCDLGESFGNFSIGNDEAVFPHITSCNIACGFHGGDPVHMKQTIQRAIEHNVQIGAHPSYPDLAGFGRRKMAMSEQELIATIQYQIAALKGMAENMGARLAYVKPHGALYNAAWGGGLEGKAMIEAVASFDLALMMLAGSPLLMEAKNAGMKVIAEAFADRRYQPDGTLTSRSIAGSVIDDADQAAGQALSIARDHKAIAIDGSEIDIHADSICIHGDNPAVVEILSSITSLLAENSIGIQRFA